MYCFRVIASLTLIGFSPFFVWAEDGYIGENPGTNFYSTIDEGDYQITTKILTKRLVEKPTLEKFGAECAGSSWVKDAPTDIKTLDAIANGNYGPLTTILKNNNAENISIDTFQRLALCLTEKYQRAKSRARDEQNNIETLSSLGLYMDGDTSNSDYDIISDIEKINMIIFSKNLKYSGEVNKSASSFHDFLSGKPVAALFGSGTPAGIAGNTGSGGTGSGGTGGTGSGGTGSGGVNLGTLIGGSCGGSTTSQDITDIIDDAFARELAATLASGPIGYPTGQGYTRNVGTPPQGTASGANANGTHTSANDFFHKMPCTSIFCIDVTMVSGSQNLLGGGKNVSIEGLLDKHTEIMGPISDSSLRYEKMQNKFGSLPFVNLNLKSILAGARIYIATRPQITRRDKREQSASSEAKAEASKDGTTAPNREDTELEDIRRCAFAGAGLNTDNAKSNSLLGAGYSFNSAANTENAQNFVKPLGAQEAETSRYVGCLEQYITAGRKSYYESFSTDLTEIQAYTASMVNEIEEILNIGTLMKSKPEK